MIVNKMKSLCGFVKIIYYKIIYGKKIYYKSRPHITKSLEVYLCKNSILNVGSNFACRKNCQLRVNDNANLIIGDNVFFNDNVSLTTRNKIVIGNNVIVGPNVSFYDHDHDYKNVSLITEDKFIHGTIIIGNNVWIGSGVIILKDTVIGNNCVIAAGTVVSGYYNDNLLIYNERNIVTKKIDKNTKL